MTRLGYAVGTVLGHDADAINEQPIVMIGRDTRQSGPSLQQALTRGLTATGAIVWDLGILPTPGVAFFDPGTSGYRWRGYFGIAQSS